MRLICIDTRHEWPAGWSAWNADDPERGTSYGATRDEAIAELLEDQAPCSD